MFVTTVSTRIQEENANVSTYSVIPWNLLMLNLGKSKNRRNQEISGNIFKASIVLIDCDIHHVINPRAFSKLNVRQLIEITNSVVTGCSTLWNTHYLMTWFFEAWMYIFVLKVSALVSFNFLFGMNCGNFAMLSFQVKETFPNKLVPTTCFSRRTRSLWW